MIMEELDVSAAAAAPSTPGPDQAYYDKYAGHTNVQVVFVPNKGKGMFAKKKFREGETVLADRGLVVAQDLADRVAGIKCCAHTMRSLETPEGTFLRVTNGKGHTLPKLPKISRYLDEEHIEGVQCQDGCPLHFVSTVVKAEADKKWHRVLCKGRMTPKQRECYDKFEHHEWSCGGVDYSDSFHLMLHAVAHVLCAEGTPTERWFPFDLLAWADWNELATSWSTKKSKTTPKKLLEAAHRYMVGMFGEEAAGSIGLTQERVSRLTGGILLNAQERSPESPFGRYLVWLDDNSVKSILPRGKFDWRAKRPTDISNDLYYSCRAQGVYRVHSTTNHSCNPNTEVQYTEDMNEHLYMVALRPIKKGEEITISYIDAPLTKGREERQEYLQQHYRFTCTCERCNEEGGKAAANGAGTGGLEEAEEWEEVEEEVEDDAAAGDEEVEEVEEVEEIAEEEE